MASRIFRMVSWIETRSIAMMSLCICSNPIQSKYMYSPTRAIDCPVFSFRLRFFKTLIVGRVGYEKRTWSNASWFNSGNVSDGVLGSSSMRGLRWKRRIKCWLASRELPNFGSLVEMESKDDCSCFQTIQVLCPFRLLLKIKYRPPIWNSD